MIGEKDLEGTNAERRVQEVLALGQKATQTYHVDKSRINNFNA